MDDDVTYTSTRPVGYDSVPKRKPDTRAGTVLAWVIVACLSTVALAGTVAVVAALIRWAL